MDNPETLIREIARKRKQRFSRVQLEIPLGRPFTGRRTQFSWHDFPGSGRENGLSAGSTGPPGDPPGTIFHWEPVRRNDSPPHLLIFPCWLRDDSVRMY